MGSFTEALGADRRPRSDAANAFAAARARSAAHLRHAASTLPFITLGLLCQRGQETRCLGRPPSSNLSCKDNEPGPPSFPCQFRVRAFLPPSRDFEYCTWSGRRTCPGSPVATQCADQRQVIRAMGASEQGQPFSDDF